MADDRLRSLERAAAGGDLDAITALLSQRVRAGDLEHTRLELAAFLGDPLARRILGDRTPDPPEPEPVPVAGVHAVAVDRAFCNVRPTVPELETARPGVPTCRRCLGSRRWRDHQRTAVTLWIELVITNYGLQAGRRVAIATVRAVVAWCRDQQRNTTPSMPFDLFSRESRDGNRLATAEEELRVLQHSLELAEAPDDPAAEAKRIVRIVDGATLMGWSDLRGKIRDEVVPWALGLETTPVGRTE